MLQERHPHWDGEQALLSALTEYLIFVDSQAGVEIENDREVPDKEVLDVDKSVSDVRSRDKKVPVDKKVPDLQSRDKSVSDVRSPDLQPVDIATMSDAQLLELSLKSPSSVALANEIRRRLERTERRHAHPRKRRSVSQRPADESVPKGITPLADQEVTLVENTTYSAPFAARKLIVEPNIKLTIDSTVSLKELENKGEVVITEKGVLNVAEDVLNVVVG